MPGRRLKLPYVGFRAEQLTIFALSAYASVVHIPIEEDYGNDLICTIVEERGKFLIPSDPFLVQCKSNESRKKSVAIYEGDAVHWFLSISTPFFISLVYLNNDPRIELYKTCEKIPLSYSRPDCKRITLKRGCDKKGKASYDSSGNIYMGEPVVRIPIADMNKRDSEILETIEYWTALEIQNYYWKNLGIKIYQRTVEYSTNQVPKDLPEMKIFYSSRETTKSQKDNAAIVLMHELYHEYAGTDGKSPKISWEKLSQSKKDFYINSIKVFEQLSPKLVDNVKKFYPDVHIQ